MLRIAAESLQMIIYQVDTRQFKERHNHADAVSTLNVALYLAT